jgi:hypothetical protein
MACNVGGFDRILRIIAGIILLLLALTGTVGAWAYIGLVPLLTGVFKFCPAYKIVGINTSK